MFSAIEILRQCVSYYDLTRRVGHTKVIVKGLKESSDETILVCGNYLNGQRIKAESGLGCDLALWETLPNDFHCKREPLVFDNFALRMLFAKAVKEYSDIEKERDRLRKKIERITQICTIK